jgi:2,3-bisphosphoglycerate-independent phosphoglycerate mutase
MKYLVLIGDGMTDYPLPALQGKTPLEVAKTPNLDFLAQHGICGWVNNVPKGLPPASDVANMSIFGYDPKKYYTGRGPLEAASLGVKLKKEEIAFRCNLVTLHDRKMKDFTAGHVSTPEATKLIKMLDEKLGRKGIKFYPGLSYRHLLVMTNDKCQMSNVCTTPPHDITGQEVKSFLPKGKGAEILLQLMAESEVLLHETGGKATTIWPWSPGKSPILPPFKKKYGLRGAIITAVHLLKGIGRLAGMEVIDVPGATGYLDTNYVGKAEYALKALKRNDIVFVHVESPDEAGHEGNIENKIKAIEDFDRLVVGTILKNIQHQTSNIKHPTLNIKLLVLPDHPTPIKLMTHTAEAVPFVIWSGDATGYGLRVTGYNEKALKKAKLRIKKGCELLSKLVKE